MISTVQGTPAYRPDIDGLRAVAVIPVVLFHAGLGLLGGGYVGVDVFFVISGYLITGILYREALDGRFSIARFYERRIRRIFPALFAMLAVTLFAGLFILLPHELVALGRSAVAATMFVSNILFWQESGYFDAASTSKPLLHTWSLAVEEQFYIFFPLVLWAVFRWLRRWLLAVVIAGALGSLALSAVLLPTAASATFYLIPTRAWELLIGSALALLPVVRHRLTAEIVSGLGLMTITASVLLYSEAMPFPGLAALPPCLGAAALILCGRETWTGRLLSTAPMRGIGLISFSLYLWHWPVLVYARLLLGDPLTPPVASFCVVIATTLAYLSWRFVEQPFRRSGHNGSVHAPLLVGTGLMAAFGLLGLGINVTGGLPFRLPPEAVAMAAAAKATDTGSPGCFLIGGPNGADLEADCVGAPSQGPKLVLWGDSHANHFAQAIGERAEAEGMQFRQAARASCAPLIGVVPTQADQPDTRCLAFNNRILEAIVADPSVTIVVLAGRWQRFGFPTDHPEARRLSAIDRSLSDSGTLLVASLDAVTTRLIRAGKRVIIIGGVPEFEQQLPECLARAMWHELGTERCAHNIHTLPGSAGDRWLAQLRARHTDVAIVKPTDILCPAGACFRTINGVAVNSDRDHLSEPAAREVIFGEAFGRALR